MPGSNLGLGLGNYRVSLLAGLGLFSQKSAPAVACSVEVGGVNSVPLVRNVLCLFYAKCSRWFRNVPDGLSRKIKSFTFKTCFWGPGWLW
jgi:hypothetical protein